MEIPISDESYFRPAELNICIFPHLREFLVIDARATVPGGPHTYLLTTGEVLDSEFYGEVEDSIREMVRDMPKTFAELGQIPQRLDDAIREHTLRAILRQVNGATIEDEEFPEVSVFLCIGPALFMSSTQMNEAVQTMLGERVDAWTLSDCAEQLRRLMSEERDQAQAEGAELAHHAVTGDNEFYFTLWSRVEAQESTEES